MTFNVEAFITAVRAASKESECYGATDRVLSLTEVENLVAKHADASSGPICPLCNGPGVASIFASSGPEREFIAAHNLAYELGGTEDGNYLSTPDDLEKVVLAEPSSGPEQTKWTPEAFKAWHLGSTQPKICAKCNSPELCVEYGRACEVDADCAKDRAEPKCACNVSRAVCSFFTKYDEDVEGCETCRHSRACHTAAPAEPKCAPAHTFKYDPYRKGSYIAVVPTTPDVKE